MTNALIASTSTVHGGGYLTYLLPELEVLFAQTDTILFIPFARAGGLSHADYTAKVALAFAQINKKVVGLHEFDSYQQALEQATGIFTGGGNTFLLI